MSKEVVSFLNVDEILTVSERVFMIQVIEDDGDDFIGEDLIFVSKALLTGLRITGPIWEHVCHRRVLSRPVYNANAGRLCMEIELNIPMPERVVFDCLNYSETKEESTMPPKSPMFPMFSTPDFEFTIGHPLYPKMTVTKNVPPIKHVEFFSDGLPTIKMTFIDDTHTEATCHGDDHFSFEVGLGICIAKRAMGNDFNKLIHKAVKIYDRGVKDLVARKAAIANAEMEHKKFLERRAKAKRRREERRIQQEIYIQTQALIAAQKAMKGEPEKEG